MPSNRWELVDLIRRHPQVRVLSHGHIHMPRSLPIDSAVQLSCPAISWQYHPRGDGQSGDDILSNSPPAYRVFNIDRDGNLLTWIRRLGATVTEEFRQRIEAT